MDATAATQPGGSSAVVAAAAAELLASATRRYTAATAAKAAAHCWCCRSRAVPARAATDASATVATASPMSCGSVPKGHTVPDWRL